MGDERAMVMRVYRVQQKQGVYHLWFGNQLLALALPADVKRMQYAVPTPPLMEQPLWMRKIVAQDDARALECFAARCLTYRAPTILRHMPYGWVPYLEH